jgi:hypothetical protein
MATKIKMTTGPGPKKGLAALNPSSKGALAGAGATLAAAYGDDIADGVKRGFKKVKKFVKNTVKQMKSVEPKRNKDGVPVRKTKK